MSLALRLTRECDVVVGAETEMREQLRVLEEVLPQACQYTASIRSSMCVMLAAVQSVRATLGAMRMTGELQPLVEQAPVTGLPLFLGMPEGTSTDEQMKDWAGGPVPQPTERVEYWKSLHWSGDHTLDPDED